MINYGHKASFLGAFFCTMFTDIVLLIAILGSNQPKVLGSSNVELASHTMSMEKRYGNTFVNDVFKDNILLTIKYMSGVVKSKNDIDWSDIEKPYHYEFSLKPNEEFAFHDKTVPEYSQNIVKTTNSHFNYTEGFKSDGYLTGDGVCHLASIVYWAAKDAGLKVVAPTNHNFAVIPEVPREDGVSIYSESGMQNLYITNNLDTPITFVFDYNGENLKVSVNVVK